MLHYSEPVSALGLLTVWSLRGNPGMASRCQETLPAKYIPQHKMTLASSSGSGFHCVWNVVGWLIVYQDLYPSQYSQKICWLQIRWYCLWGGNIFKTRKKDYIRTNLPWCTPQSQWLSHKTVLIYGLDIVLTGTVLSPTYALLNLWGLLVVLRPLLSAILSLKESSQDSGQSAIARLKILSSAPISTSLTYSNWINKCATNERINGSKKSKPWEIQTKIKIIFVQKFNTQHNQLIAGLIFQKF